MKPNLSFEVVRWYDKVRVLRGVIYGTDQNGQWVEKTIEFPQPCHIDAAHAMVAKMNNGSYRG